MTTTKTKKKTEKPDTPPAWASELAEKYQVPIAHAFILHGNVQDYVGGVPGQSLKQYLISSFGKRQIIVSWNRATGFHLPTQEMRQRFAETVEFPIPGGSPQPARTGLSAGLNQMAGGQTADLSKLLERVRHPADALDYLNRLLRTRTKDVIRAAVIIDYTESITPADSSGENERAALVTLSEWSREMGIGERGHIITLITDDLSDIHERLLKSSVRWEQIEVPYPSFDERVAFIRTLIEADGIKLAANFTPQDMARMTTGLRFIDLEDIFLRADFLGTTVSPAIVKARKDEIVASEFGELLAIEENTFGFEAVGGMNEIKEDLRETVIAPMINGEYRLVPQGLLLMGPAGTGKTRLARALAKESGVTFVELNLAKIMLKWVGSTERRLERALTAIKSMAPCIVFIDEIDQAISRGEHGDSGTSNRIFKRLMEIMADTTLRGKVLWTCASNRADLLDPALLRPGRMDKKIPILAPDASERTAILQVLTVQAFGDTATLPTTEEYQGLAEQMEGYTGAEIEAVTLKAFQLYARSKKQWSIEKCLQEAYARIIPSTQDIERMTRIALLHCNDLDLVPEQYRDLARQLRHPAGQSELLDESRESEPQRRARKRDW